MKKSYKTFLNKKNFHFYIFAKKNIYSKKKRLPPFQNSKKLKRATSYKKKRNISFQPTPIKKIMKQLTLSSKHEIGFFFFLEKK